MAETEAAEIPPAEGVERVDVEPVNRPEKRSLYAKRKKIHPRRIYGRFRSIKWVVMALTLTVYYGAPWLRWDRGPNAPDQAILIDFPARRFYFFFIEIWPQEVYYLTGLLIIAALSLFLATSLLGRVWCGYTCPQTVWTDLFILVERAVEGDRSARIRLDAQRWNFDKLRKRVVKHSIWILIALCTGGAWVFYFADAPTLLGQLLRFEAPTVAYTFIGLFSATTYLLGGIAREQVCTFMCPWPRIQGAMVDENSLLVGYRKYRGEPRGAYRKGESWDNRGDCIDCKMCVAVCPMGIDIRDGLQLECISCALCIDACNTVMDRIGRPRNLIAYDTVAGIEAGARGEKPSLPPLVRPRTLIYAGLIALVGAIMLVTLIDRPPVDVNVLRDRNPLFVTLADGSIRNGYTVKILNKHHDQRRFRLSVEGVEGATLSLVGADPASVTVGSDRLRSLRAYIAVPRAALKGESTPIDFVVTDLTDKTRLTHDTTLRGPGR